MLFFSNNTIIDHIVETVTDWVRLGFVLESLLNREIFCWKKVSIFIHKLGTKFRLLDLWTPPHPKHTDE